MEGKWEGGEGERRGEGEGRGEGERKGEGGVCGECVPLSRWMTSSLAAIICAHVGHNYGWYVLLGWAPKVRGIGAVLF